MIRVSARDASTKDELAEALSGRLHALASADALLRRTASDGGNTAELGTLIKKIMQPHDAARGESRFLIAGPPVICGTHAMNGLALAMHELATNSAKYDALSSPRGKINVRWDHEGDTLLLHWDEQDGPSVEGPPPEEGFGSALVRTMISQQFGGTLNYDWQRSGLTVTISLPSASLFR